MSIKKLTFSGLLLYCGWKGLVHNRFLTVCNKPWRIPGVEWCKRIADSIAKWAEIMGITGLLHFSLTLHFFRGREEAQPSLEIQCLAYCSDESRMHVRTFWKLSHFSISSVSIIFLNYIRIFINCLQFLKQVWRSNGNV